MVTAWALKRLRVLERGSRRYNRWDTINAYLKVRNLVTEEICDDNSGKRLIAITAEGRAAYAVAGHTERQSRPLL